MSCLVSCGQCFVPALFVCDGVVSSFCELLKRRVYVCACLCMRVHVRVRRYRSGELPDIQIKHRELLLPLQALHLDPVFASMLFNMLFKAIYTHIANPQRCLRWIATRRSFGCFCAIAARTLA